MPQKKYVLNNEYYILPEKTLAVDYGDRLVVYLNGKIIDSLDDYRVSFESYSRKRSFEYLMPCASDLAFYADQYENVGKFLNQKPNMTNLQFDNATQEDMILFSFLPNLDLSAIDALLEQINKTMPFIMNIFLRPVIHLKSEEFIVPVETVKKTDQRTIHHILQHSEHWKTLGHGGNSMKPARLLTTLYEDDYTIYENRVFCRTMDQVIAALKKYKNVFTDIIYNKISFDLSVGDKSNHLYHYLALGKLYVGYVKSDELFAERCNDYNDMFDRIISKLSSQKIRPVYKKNRKFKIGNTVNRTNILAMHRDYRHIYKLKLLLNRRDETLSGKEILSVSKSFNEDYQSFCNMLTVFAVTHFRFKTKEKALFRKGKFSGANFEFSKWNITLTPKTIKCAKLSATLMSVATENAKYDTLLIPYPASLDNNNTALINGLLKDLAKEHACQNYIFFTPAKSNQIPSYYSNDKISCGFLPLSVNDINSFKRIQKLAMIGMIKTSSAHDLCPFCGGEFEQETDNSYFCKKCKTELTEIVCPHCQKNFTATSARYPHLKNNRISPQNYTPDSRWKFCLDTDTQQNYRNITPISQTGSPTCPHCNK